MTFYRNSRVQGPVVALKTIIIQIRCLKVKLISKWHVMNPEDLEKYPKQQPLQKTLVLECEQKEEWQLLKWKILVKVQIAKIEPRN